jgi:hypothetical protein
MKRGISMALFEGFGRVTIPKPQLRFRRWQSAGKANKDWSRKSRSICVAMAVSQTAIQSQPGDFVYTIQRGLKPETASRVASLAYPIKYAQAFNEGDVFVYDSRLQNHSSCRKILATDAQPQLPLSAQPVASIAAEISGDSRRPHSRC